MLTICPPQKPGLPLQCSTFKNRLPREKHTYFDSFHSNEGSGPHFQHTLFPEHPPHSREEPEAPFASLPLCRAQYCFGKKEVNRSLEQAHRLFGGDGGLVTKLCPVLRPHGQ